MSTIDSQLEQAPRPAGQNPNPGVSYFVLGLMASVTFVGILSELVPSGILTELSEGLTVSEAQVGSLVGVYALASAIFAIPMVSLTLGMNRKRLLLMLLTGFAASNILIGFSSSYYFIMAMRVIGGICAGIMWPMIAAYGVRLVSEERQGQAITLIMSGNTFGVSIGLPIMTSIGTQIGWRAEFIALGLVVVLIALLSIRYLPAVPGEKLSRSNSPFAVLKRPTVLIILLLTFLTVVAHYGTYTYIRVLVEHLAVSGGIEWSLLIFGFGSVFSVIYAARVIDRSLRGLIVQMLAVGTVAMLLLIFFGQQDGFVHMAFFMWGLAFGPVVTMYQTAVSKQVTEAKDVATSVQSSVFNFSIMIATWIGGMILTSSAGVIGIVWLSVICFVPAAIVAYFARKTLAN